MANIQKRALALLDRIYGFPGGSGAPREVEIGQPVTLVHDVSREAELAPMTRNGGWFLLEVVNTHAAAGNENGVIEPFADVLTSDVLSTGGVTALDLSMWLWDFTVTGDPDLIDTRCSVGLLYQAATALPTYTVEFGKMLFHCTTGNKVQNRNYANTAYVDYPDNELVQDVVLPIPIFEHSRIVLATDLNAAGVFSLHCLLWVGLRGTSPPGFQ